MVPTPRKNTSPQMPLGMDVLFHVVSHHFHTEYDHGLFQRAILGKRHLACHINNGIRVWHDHSKTRNPAAKQIGIAFFYRWWRSPRVHKKLWFQHAKSPEIAKLHWLARMTIIGLIRTMENEDNFGSDHWRNWLKRRFSGLVNPLRSWTVPQIRLLRHPSKKQNR